MKKHLIFLICLFVSANIYSQSRNNDNHTNQIIQNFQKFGEDLEKELQRSSKLAMSSSKKDIYVLYMNGHRMGCFSDEYSCKAKITDIKSRLEKLMGSIISEFPNEAKAAGRDAAKKTISGMSLTYRKEANPNYREPTSYNTAEYAPAPSFGENSGEMAPPIPEPRPSIFDTQPTTQQNNQQEPIANDVPPIRKLTNTEPPKEEGIRIAERPSSSAEGDTQREIALLKSDTLFKLNTDNFRLEDQINGLNNVQLQEKQKEGRYVIGNYVYSSDVQEDLKICKSKLEEDLLPKANEILSNYDSNVEKLKTERTLFEAELSELESNIAENEKVIALNRYKRRLVAIQDYGQDVQGEKQKLLDIGIDEKTINEARNEVWEELARVDPAKTVNMEESKSSRFMKALTNAADAEDRKYNVVTPIQRGLVEKKYDDIAKKHEEANISLASTKEIKSENLKNIDLQKQKLTLQKDKIIETKEYYNNILQGENIKMDKTDEIDAMNFYRTMNYILEH